MLFQALIMAAALAEPAAPPAGAPPAPPTPGFALSGVETMTLSFDEKGKKREIVIKMHGADAPAEVVVDGKAVKDVALSFTADRVSLLAGPRAFTWSNGPGDKDVRFRVERALELAEKGEGAGGKPRIDVFRLESETGPGADGKPRIELFRFGSGDGPGADGARSCVDSGTEIVCTFKKPGAPAAPKPPEAPK